MPQLGESIAEATVIKVLLKKGSLVEADSDVIEVETNKAVMAVASPCAGKLSQILIEEGQSYPVGAILAYLEVSPEEARRMGLEEETASPTPRRKKARRRPGSSNRPSRRCPYRHTPAGSATCRRG